MSGFSKRLVSLRKSKGVSQSLAAKEIGISIRAYQKYEYEESEPTLSIAARIADFYGVSLDYLVGRSETASISYRRRQNVPAKEELFTVKLQELVRDLYGVDRPQGCTKAEIAAMKERFGALPAMVEKFWRTFGHTKQLNCGQDSWVFPKHYAKWKWLEKFDALVLLNENQSVGQACIRREDLFLPDPPVYLVIDPKDPWELASPTVSEFLEAALIYEAVWQLPCSPDEIFELSEADLEVVQARLTRRSAVLKNWFVTETTFFSSRPDNLVVVMDMGNGEYQAAYGASSQESYTALLEVMEGLGEPV